MTRRDGMKASRRGAAAPAGGPVGNHLRLLRFRVGISTASADSRRTSPCTTKTWPNSVSVSGADSDGGPAALSSGRARGGADRHHSTATTAKSEGCCRGCVL
eukprot:5186035-Prymnesium_polylepis.1